MESVSLPNIIALIIKDPYLINLVLAFRLMWFAYFTTNIDQART